MKAASIMLIILLLAGCAHVPHYALDATSTARSPRHAMKIAVAPFVDKRPKGWDAPMRLKIKEKGGSEMIVKHFEYVKLYAHQGVVGFDFQRPTSEQLITLKSKGYDAILTGSITHYYGGYSKTTFMEIMQSPLVIVMVFIPILFVPIAIIGANINSQAVYFFAEQTLPLWVY